MRKRSVIALLLSVLLCLAMLSACTEEGEKGETDPTAALPSLVAPTGRTDGPEESVPVQHDPQTSGAATPDQTDAGETEPPKPTEPDQPTQPTQPQPTPTQPQPTQPQPTQPTQPQPTQPTPTQPDPGSTEYDDSDEDEPAATTAAEDDSDEDQPANP